VTRITVVYSSTTGNVHALARAVAEGAMAEGAQVRLRQVPELPTQMQISVKQDWGCHRSEPGNQPQGRLEDFEWADGIAFGTPTRFGNVAAQLKAFVRALPRGSHGRGLDEEDASLEARQGRGRIRTPARRLTHDRGTAGREERCQHDEPT
jgi:NAD(P)H dehydrogenase (quinone)